MDMRQKGERKPVNKRRVGQVAVGAILVAVVFCAGIAVGDGRIALPSKQAAVSKNLPTQLNYNSVDEVYKSLKENYDGKLTQTQLEDGLKHGLADATNDPYTTYFTAKEAKAFDQELNLSFSGIGAELGQDEQKNIQIISPIDGFPAQKAGLKAKDIIAEINGKSTAGMTVDDAVKNIRGKSGTEVKLKVIRDKQEQLDFTITRQSINPPSVESKTLDGNIGYIKISRFANDTTQLTQQAAEKLKAQGVKSVVLDLRNNGGGYLEGAVTVSSLWLPQGKQVLQEKTGNVVKQTYDSIGTNTLGGVPTVVLINGGSASASEITAGALKDNKAAYLIGEKSYGKGVVQEIINFRDGSQLKVTVASWYRPNGQNINKRGITPDKTIKITDEEAKAGTDTQLQAAQDYLNK